MFKRCVVVIILVTVATITAAADSAVPFLPKEYTLLCEAKDSVGLDWDAGNWHKVNFTLKKRIVTKSDENKCLLDNPPTNDLDLDMFVTRHECLNVRDFGGPYRPNLSHLCSVYYSKSGTTWDVNLECNDPVMKFKPDGWYHLAFIHSDLSDRPIKNYKDSLYVEVGKCTRIK